VLPAHDDPLRLIVNGKAAGNQALRAAVEAMRREDVRLEVRVTWEGGDAVRYAADALQDEVDVAVAASGDGTINEVVSGIMNVSESPDVAVGVIPFGTANDFATGCGIPIDDPLAALSRQLVANSSRSTWEKSTTATSSTAASARE